MTTTIKTTLWAMLMLLFAGSLLTSCNESEDKEETNAIISSFFLFDSH